VLIFTSGTTGRPKAVTIAHRTICGFAQVNSFNEAVASVAMGGPVPAPGEVAPPADEVVLVTAPLFHVSMLYGAVLQGVLKGSAFVLLPGRFDPEQVLRAIDRERVTMWMALGRAAPRVSAHPDLSRYDTSSLRFVGVGGAPVSPAVQQGLRDAFPTVSQSVGMAYTSTEGGSIVANISGADLVAYPTSTGRVAATVEVEGELGEVHVRSPYLMLGYWNDADASAAVLKPGGWLAMGDMARMVAGLLYIDSGRAT
jgi:long-chain acyl-CoA synthetase